MIKSKKQINYFDRNYINELRGASILRVMMVHLGLSWFYMPYSSYIGALLPLLFFVSGAVSFFSYHRASSTITFVYKRLVSIIIPYYLLVFLVFILSLLAGNWQIINLGNWLVIAPDTSNLPFSLGQVWFLQSLVLITLITLPVYYLTRIHVNFLLLYALFSLTLIAANTFWGIHEHFIFFEKIDLYLAFSNSYFCMLGALYFSYQEKIKSRTLFICSLLMIISGLSLNSQTFDFSLGRHMESPDVIYLLCSTGTIGILLSYKKALQFFLDRLSHLKYLLLYCSKHTYSIYLLHTLVLGGVEALMFKEQLTGNFSLAILKMLLVIILTLFVAPIYSQFSNFFLKMFKQIGLDRSCANISEK